MDESTVSTEAFFDAFDETADYQTGNADNGAENQEAEATESEHVSDEPAPQGDTAPQDGENGEDSHGDAGEKPAAEGSQAGDSFTIKVNKEERTVSREEMITLAQKGADYDRVKAAVDKGKSDNEALTAQIAQMQPVYDLVNQIAKDAQVEVTQLLDAFQLQQLQEKEGLTKNEATERLARRKAEMELQRLKASPASQTPEQTRKERMDREVAEFQQLFPDVPLAQVPVDALMADVQAGKTLSQAYQGYLMAQKDAEITRLNAEIAAKAQDSKNRASSPGSASDSGSKRTKSQFEDFWAAFD